MPGTICNLVSQRDSSKGTVMLLAVASTVTIFPELAPVCRATAGGTYAAFLLTDVRLRPVRLAS